MSSKREAFKTYITERGILSSLTGALVKLYEEKDLPSDPLNYIRQSIGASEGVDVEELLRENKMLRERAAALRSEIETLESTILQQEGIV